MRSLVFLSLVAAAEAANPIRKIVTLLQDMKKEVAAEGEKEQELYEKFMCFCKNNKGSLGESAEKAQAQIDDLEAKIKGDESEKAQLTQDLSQHKKDRAAAKQDLETASKLREKEHKTYVEEAGDTKTNLDAVSKAIPALEKGMGAAFLQTPVASHLKQVVSDFAQDGDRETVMAFLEQSKDYAPASGEIVGILKNMKDEMDKSLGGIVSDEEAAVKSFGELKAAKEKEIAAAGAAIESKTERAGKLAVSIVQSKAARDNAAEELSDSQKFAADLEKNCADKTAEWEERQATRSQELVAIGEAIKILNDDEALEIFNKALPKPALAQQSMGFLQVRVGKSSAVVKARAVLTSFKSKNPAISLLQATLLSKLRMQKVDFGKVLKMIDDMVTLLKTEQKDDASHRDWCNAEFDTSADTKKETTEKLNGLTSTIAEITDSIEAVAADIKETQAKIAALDTTVAEAGEQRKKEHAEYNTAHQLNTAAKELIFKAKNRLQKFYNPDLHVKTQRRELTQEEQILVNNGGADPRDAEEAAAAQARQEELANMAFIQLHQQAAVDPPQAPETFSGGVKKNKGGNSVTALMDMMVKDIEKDMQESKFSEETAQKEYQELVADAQKTKAQDSKTVTSKQTTKADMEGQLDEAKNGQTLTTEALNQVTTYIQELHGSCDFILNAFEQRKEARTNEIDGLTNAKAVLSGADYSF